MSEKHLATYLNDHLAGSTVALELLKYLVNAHQDDAVGLLAAQINADVLTDRRELERRAEEQRNRLETMRLELASKALRKEDGSADHR